LHISV